jgi:hypothetical protein
MPLKTSNARRPRVTFRPLPASGLPKLIPPRSVVILAKTSVATTPDWQNDLGRIFRVGYYNRRDGTDCIWLVNEKGKYEQTTDRQTMLKHFVILKLSNETDIFGDHQPPLKPLRTARTPAFAIPSLFR